MSAVFIRTVFLFDSRPNKEQKRGKEENLAPVYNASPRLSTTPVREPRRIEPQLWVPVDRLASGVGPSSPW